MVSPIRGPITRNTITYQNINGLNYPQSYRFQNVMLQAPPYGQPLGYNTSWARKTSTSGASGLGSAGQSPLIHEQVGWEGPFEALNNRTYARLIGKMSDQAELGVALSELSKSATMLEDRLVQLWRFAGYLRQGDFKRAARSLERTGDTVNYRFGLGRKNTSSRVSRNNEFTPRYRTQQGPSHSKSMASNWLEYSYGWAPTVSDIGNCIDVLQNPVKATFLKSSSKESISFNANYPPQIGGTIGRLYLRHCVVKLSCQVAVSNPNLRLASQLGFVNPATFVWEKIPFSFVADWFGNLNQVMASMTDFVGLHVQHAYTTKHYLGSSVHAYKEFWPQGHPLKDPVLDKNGVDSFSFGRTQRSLGLTGPTLALKPVVLTGLNRGLNAAALLTGFIHSLK